MSSSQREVKEIGQATSRACRWANMWKAALGLGTCLLLGACAADDGALADGVDDLSAASLDQSDAADGDVTTTLDGATTGPTGTSEPSSTTIPDGSTTTTVVATSTAPSNTSSTSTTSSTAPTKSASGVSAPAGQLDPATLEALLPTAAELEALGFGTGWAMGPVTVEPARAPNSGEPMCGLPDPGRAESISVLYSSSDERFLSILLGGSVPESTAAIASLAMCDETGITDSGRIVPGANASLIGTSEEQYAALFATFDVIEVASAYFELVPESSAQGSPASFEPSGADFDALTALATQIAAHAG